MKNADIAKIRQLLQKAQKEVGNLTPADVCYPLYGEVAVEKTISKAIALLPCPTCDGADKLRNYNSAGQCTSSSPCPDCQKKPIDKQS